MTAEELLMMSDDVETYIADDALVIDPESRTILTPANGLILGVESDEEAERVHFVCPRVVGDNIDLSELQIRTIYQNANGDKDFRICTDVSVDGDNVRFSWLLSRKVTKYKGKVKFIVCAIRANDDGTIRNEWNTTLAEGISLEGLEVDIPEEELEEPKDIVLQLLGMLDERGAQLIEEVENLRTDVKEDIESTKQNAMDEVEAKGKATLETIPEDYTYTANLAKENKQLKANAIKRTYSGETIVATDSAEAKFEGLRVFGRSEQVSTTGVQLFNGDTEYTSVNFGSALWENDKLTVVGAMVYAVVTVEPNTTYTISYKSTRSGENGGGVYVRTKNADNVTTAVVKQQHTLNGTFSFTTLDDTNAIDIVFYGSALKDDTTNYAVFSEIQLQLGTQATECEKFTGGKPSPNPDYPQPIESVGDRGSIDIGVCGGNLCDNVWEQGTISTVNGSNVASLADVRTANYIKVIPYKPMYIKRNIIGSYLRTRTYDKDFKYIGGGESAGYELIKGETLANPMGNKVSECILKFTNENVKYLRLIDHTNDLNTKYFVGLYDGTVDDVYSDEQTLTIPTPNGLPGIKVTDASLATYTDADGVMWCADEVVCGEKKIQRVYQETFDGSDDEKWTDRTSDYTNKSDNQRRYSVTLPNKIYGGSVVGMSNIGFLGVIGGVTEYTDNGISLYYLVDDDSKIAYITIENDEVTNLDTFKTWLSNNPVTVQYTLAEPIETDLSVSEIEAYRALHSNYPTTTILNDENAHMEDVLVTDTKNHIEQNYASLDSYKALEARVLAVEQALA